MFTKSNDSMATSTVGQLLTHLRRRCRNHLDLARRLTCALPIFCLAAPVWSDIEFVDAPGVTLTGDMTIDAAQGETLGTNLLHSFLRFNVLANESATFTGPAELTNVIARVSGSEMSTINGLLRSAITDADLFLINPNGVVFGAGAQIEVDGQLIASTASSLEFADGSQLLISDSGSSGFSAAAPEAFGFDADPGAITFDGVNITSGANGLSVIGGDIIFDDSSITMETGSIELIAMGANATAGVSGDRAPDPDANLGSINLAASGFDPVMNVSGTPAGTIMMVAGTILMDNASVFADTFDEDAAPGGITVYAPGSLTLQNGSRLTAASLGTGDGSGITIEAGAVTVTGFDTAISAESQGFFEGGKGGQISINTNSLAVTNFALIGASTQGDGDAGNVDITATGIMVNSGARISALTQGSGSGGTINLNTSSLDVDGAETRIDTESIGFFVPSGAGGSININSDTVTLSGGAQLSSVAQGPEGGQPGNISIVANRVDVLTLAIISSLAASPVGGANIQIDAGTVRVEGRGTTADENSSIISSTVTAASGGLVTINADNLEVVAGGKIRAETSSTGDAGTISINGTNLIVDNGEINAATFGDGRGGVIAINVNAVDVSNGGSIETGSPDSLGATGAGGDIAISGNRVTVSGGSSRIASQTNSGGRGGNIALNLQELRLEAGGLLDTSAAGTGDAGTISVSASDTWLTGATTAIASSTTAAGTGGTVSIAGANLTVADSARVSVTSAGAGNAGNINLALTHNLEITDLGRIETNAAVSGGGNITANAVNQIYLRDATLTASSGGPESGDDGGNVSIDPVFFILQDSTIVAQAVRGNGGIINLVADNFISDTHSFIDASSELGNDGEVRITSPDNAITGVIGVLNSSFSQGETLLDEPCAARALADRSSLLVPGPSRNIEAPDDYSIHHATACSR